MNIFLEYHKHFSAAMCCPWSRAQRLAKVDLMAQLAKVYFLQAWQTFKIYFCN